MRGVIYKYTNLKNGKVYIGQMQGSILTEQELSMD